MNFWILISETLHLPAKFNLNIFRTAIFMYDSVVSVHKSLIPNLYQRMNIVHKICERMLLIRTLSNQSISILLAHSVNTKKIYTNSWQNVLRHHRCDGILCNLEKRQMNPWHALYQWRSNNMICQQQHHFFMACYNEIDLAHK